MCAKWNRKVTVYELAPLQVWLFRSLDLGLAQNRGKSLNLTISTKSLRLVNDNDVETRPTFPDGFHFSVFDELVWAILQLWRMKKPGASKSSSPLTSFIIISAETFTWVSRANLYLSWNDSLHRTNGLAITSPTSRNAHMLRLYDSSAPSLTARLMLAVNWMLSLSANFSISTSFWTQGQ